MVWIEVKKYKSSHEQTFQKYISYVYKKYLKYIYWQKNTEKRKDTGELVVIVFINGSKEFVNNYYIQELF